MPDGYMNPEELAPEQEATDLAGVGETPKATREQSKI